MRCGRPTGQVYGRRLLEMTMWGWKQHSSQEVSKEKKNPAEKKGKVMARGSEEKQNRCLGSHQSK